MSKTRKKVAEDEVTQTPPEPEVQVELETELEPEQVSEPQDEPEVQVEAEIEVQDELESAADPEPGSEAQDEGQQALETALLEAAPKISLDTYNASYRGGRMTAFQCAALGNVAGTHDRTAQEWEQARAAILGG